MPTIPGIRTKLIIRNLPPTLPQDAAVEALHTAISPQSYNYFDYIPGKLSATTIRPSRLYVNLIDPADVQRVAAALHGKLFVSQRGAQFRATVEYAPFQRIPRPGKPDKRTGTIEGDSDYVAFCARLTAPPQSQEPVAAVAAQHPTTTTIITPLMQALIDKHTPAPKAPFKSTKKPTAAAFKKSTTASQQSTKIATASKTAASKTTTTVRSNNNNSSSSSGKGGARGGGANSKASTGSNVVAGGKASSRSKATTTGSTGSKDQMKQAKPSQAQAKPAAGASQTKPGAGASQAKPAAGASQANLVSGVSQPNPTGSQQGPASSTPRAPQERRVRAGFQVYQPKARGRGGPT